MFEISRVQPAEHAEFGNEPRASARWRLRHVAVPFGTANSEFKIQDSKLLLGAQPAEVAHDCKELRASAAPRLRPADPCGIEFSKTVENGLKRVDYC